MTPDDITGEIKVTREVKDNSIVYTYEWIGGDVMAMNFEVLLNPGLDIRLEAGYLRVGPFLLLAIGADQDRVYFRRVS